MAAGMQSLVPYPECSQCVVDTMQVVEPLGRLYKGDVGFRCCALQNVHILLQREPNCITQCVKLQPRREVAVAKCRRMLHFPQ